jgi:hypothetical protein
VGTLRKNGLPLDLALANAINNPRRFLSRKATGRWSRPIGVCLPSLPPTDFEY